MKTLVTGAGGFLGGHIVAKLSARAEDVVATDLTWPQPIPDGVEHHTGSILDPDLMAQAMCGADAVIHCAAISDLWSPNRWDFDRVNVAGTCRVLAAARRTGARVVHVSSNVTLIGEGITTATPLDETIELPPSNMLGPYPRSKRQAELFVRAASHVGLNAVMVLPSAPIGTHDHRPTPPGKLLRDLAAGNVPALLDCKLNLVDVNALADGIIAARDHGEIGARYLMTGEDIRLPDLAAKVAHIAGRSAPTRRIPLHLALGAAHVNERLSRLTGRAPAANLTGVRLAAQRVRFSNARAIEELGFNPPPIDQILEEAVHWHLSQIEGKSAYALGLA